MNETATATVEEVIDLEAYRDNQASKDLAPSRTQRMKKAHLDSKPTICMERALAFTRSFKETEGESTPLRLAKAVKKLNLK
jgi:hypothetical protein